MTPNKMIDTRLDTVEKTGAAILVRMHEHYRRGLLDDTEFIPFAKAVMQGVADQLAADGIPKGKIEAVGSALKEFCKQLYVKGWVKNREEDETIAEAEKKGAKYFEYLFKHGKHPPWQYTDEA